MTKVRRMLIYVALLISILFLGLVLFWYVQTRNVEMRVTRWPRA